MCCIALQHGAFPLAKAYTGKLPACMPAAAAATGRPHGRSPPASQMQDTNGALSAHPSQPILAPHPLYRCSTQSLHLHSPKQVQAEVQQARGAPAGEMPQQGQGFPSLLQQTTQVCAGTGMARETTQVCAPLVLRVAGVAPCGGAAAASAAGGAVLLLGALLDFGAP